MLVTRLGPDELLIDYVSERRMSGLATYFDEADRIDVMPTTAEEGARVRIHVRRT